MHSLEPLFYGVALHSSKCCCFRLSRKTSSVQNMRVFCYSLNTTVSCLDTTAHAQRMCRNCTNSVATGDLGIWGFGSLKGVLEQISHRHSGNYPCALIISPAGGLWLVMSAPCASTLPKHGPAASCKPGTWSWAAVSCWNRFIFTLDETTSRLSMSYKGTRCGNAHWPMMTDHWCSIWCLQGSTSRTWNVDLVAALLLSLHFIHF